MVSKAKPQVDQAQAAGGRNLVVCCDGTSNEIGKLLSNVLKLYRIAEGRAPASGVARFSGG